MHRIFEWVILSCIDYCETNVHKFKINYISTIALVCEGFAAIGSTLHLITDHWDVGPFEPRLQYPEKPDIIDIFH